MDETKYTVDVCCTNCDHCQTVEVEKGKLATGPWKCDRCECQTAMKPRPQLPIQYVPVPYMNPMPQPLAPMPPYQPPYINPQPFSPFPNNPWRFGGLGQQLGQLGGYPQQ